MSWKLSQGTITAFFRGAKAPKSSLNLSIWNFHIGQKRLSNHHSSPLCRIQGRYCR